MLNVKLVETESRRSERSSTPDALDLTMRARAILNRGHSRENRAAAARLTQQALQLAPDDVQALAGLAYVLAADVADLWSEAPVENLGRAETLAARALALDPYDASCHLSMGLVRRVQSRFDEATSHLESAIRLNPNLHLAHAQLGLVKLFSGQGDEASPHFAEMIRLSPRDPALFFGYVALGLVRFLCGDDHGAIAMMRKAIALSADYSPAYLLLTAAYGLQGRLDDARTALAAYLRTGPPVNTIALVRARASSTHPVYLAQRERLFEGLRKAGMPEE